MLLYRIKTDKKVMNEQIPINTQNFTSVKLRQESTFLLPLLLLLYNTGKQFR